jgi:uncharacterized protein YqjF (DUF2071 family)
MEKVNLMSGRWSHLVHFNYEVEKSILEPYLPAGAEIDLFNGKTWLSMVGLLFEDLAVLGVEDSLHKSFEQIDLRFYVRYPGDHGWNHGVVFIDHIVPEPVMAGAARLVGGEPYRSMEMKHHIAMPTADTEAAGTVEYSWKNGENWCSMRAVTTGARRQMNPGSKEEFLTHRLWAYSPREGTRPMIYRVEHPRWHYRPVGMATLECDVASLYGRQLADFIRPTPTFAFVAEGSEVEMGAG